MSDDCICKGNWRKIVQECEPLFGRQYRADRTGKHFSLAGVMLGDDDYYYVLWPVEGGGVQLLSCVGSIEGFGYSLINEHGL
jgi:hypothetical protein